MPHQKSQVGAFWSVFHTIKYDKQPMSGIVSKAYSLADFMGPLPHASALFRERVR